MTPKKKAKELVDKYLQIEDSEFKNGATLMFKIEAKQCALIAVDFHIEFLQEVKQEIELL